MAAAQSSTWLLGIERHGASGLVFLCSPKLRTAAIRRLSGLAARGPEHQIQRIEVPGPTSANPLFKPVIETENVHRVYDTIAEHWNHTRYKAWPRVDAFIKGLPMGTLVADLGCGNGKNIPAIHDARGFAVPSDMSAPLARIAAYRHRTSTLVADCLCTPFRSSSFDAVLSIAVLHHLSTEPRRVQALREAARLLRLGGKLLLYCWSFEQDDQRSRSKHRFTGQDNLVPWKFRAPDSQVQEVFQRYCHVYKENELQELLAQVQELAVEEIYTDTGNLCAIARRC